MAYKHGIYGEAKSASVVAEKSQGTIPVYIGSLPVHRIQKEGDFVNAPILINSYREVNELGIYSDDWNTYTLCEAIHAHFVNTDVPTAPIVLVNILDPAEKVTETTTEVEVNLVKEGTSHVGYINDPKCVIDDLAITAPSVTFSDGELTYAYDGDRVKIKITKSNFSANSVTATYKTIDFKADEVTTAEFQKALDVMDFAEHITGYVPNILASPVFSAKPEMHELMVQKAIDKLAEKWHIIVNSDIPATTVKTCADAKTWKATNQYSSKLDKLYYPMVAHNGKIYHLSTLATQSMQYIDIQNDDIPYISVSNKAINADSIVLADGTKMYITESQANELNEVGITTVNAIKGQIRLWGSHMSNYNYDNISKIPAEERFDICVRMACYMFNYLQYNFLDEIDMTVTKKDLDAITNSVQTWLDSLVNANMLLYASIRFDDDTDIGNGDIVFSIDVTYPIIAKSITFKLVYTSKGISVLTEGGTE